MVFWNNQISIEVRALMWILGIAQKVISHIIMDYLRNKICEANVLVTLATKISLVVIMHNNGQTFESETLKSLISSRNSGLVAVFDVLQNYNTSGACAVLISGHPDSCRGEGCGRKLIKRIDAAHLVQNQPQGARRKYKRVDYWWALTEMRMNGLVKFKRWHAED